MGDKHPGGRPSDYTLELAEEICDAVGNNSKALHVLCGENPHWPHRETIRRWIMKHSEFCSMYAQAKLNQADYMAEEILSIADDDSHDFIEDKDGNDKLNSEHVQRSRLRVDTRKWLASKFAPKVYGERKTTEHDVAEGSVMQKVIDKL